MRNPLTAGQALVRGLNTSPILEQLRTSAPLSRADISARTGLNPKHCLKCRALPRSEESGARTGVVIGRVDAVAEGRDAYRRVYG